MMPDRPVPGFSHQGLTESCGSSITEARLNDRRKLALLIQGAALLSHLEAARWRLVCGWSEATVDRDGTLCGLEATAGKAANGEICLLIDLIEVIHGSRDRVFGKGPAKRIVDELLLAITRSLGTMPINRAVTTLLSAADFIWEPAYSKARRSLVSEIRGETGALPRIAGPGAFELSLLSQRRDYGGLSDLLASSRAAGLWQRADGRSQEALRLYRNGQWIAALRRFAKSSAQESQLLAIDCQRRLGKLRVAKTALRKLTNESPLTGAARDLAVDVGVALALETKNRNEAERWIERLSTEADGHRCSLATLLKSETAAAVDDWVEARSQLRGELDLGAGSDRWWRWHRVRALEAGTRGDWRAAEVAMREGLADGRRSMTRLDAVTMWSALARIRLELGDLGRAAVAAGHALRLAQGIDDSWESAVSRLKVEIRVRQGRALDLDLEAPAFAVATRHVSLGSCPQIAELLARRELYRGNPSTTRRYLEPVVDRGDGARSWERSRVATLAARALGWSGQGAEARAVLQTLQGETPMGLEPEEYPALWALAGDWQRARAAAAGTPIGELWSQILSGASPGEEAWRAVWSLGAFRGARLILDLKMLEPDSVPKFWSSWAAERLREAGADPLAEKLDRTRKGTWAALTSYLRSGSGAMQELGGLFGRAGYFDIRLEWRSPDSSHCLVSGQGGAERLKSDLGGGELILAAKEIDPALETLFALTARDLCPEIEGIGALPATAGGMLGRSSALRSAIDKLERLACAEVAVLIQGETGTGKELAARQLHELSSRAARPFLAVNCAALSETLLLSDLFGHVRGAYTGADRSRAGIFEAAAGGTVLLDEIGDLPLAAQGKLLRVLQEGEVRRVGESVARRVDVRVIAATHRDLEGMVQQSSFRRDLYYRLRVGCVELPPLRSREGDVLILSEHFLRGSGRRLTPRARQCLMQHDWPGNVRELQNVLEVAQAMSGDRLIDLDDLDLPFSRGRPSGGYHKQVEEYRQRLVREALAGTGGRRREAAERLGLSRQALSYLVRRFNIEVRS